MQTSLPSPLRDTPHGAEADRILRTCVHCGFCNATCPTYQVLGNELDGPRGRIYLIKQLLEGAPAGSRTLTHLDRCLTCRACETTCPSGVEYARLADIGRREAERVVGRHWLERLYRLALRKVFPRPALARVVFAAGRAARPWLPPSLREQIPPAPPAASGPPARPDPEVARRVLLLGGCVQAAAAPGTNEAASRVLGRLGITTVVPPAAGCCGAISHHLNAHREGLEFMRRNVDAWWPHLQAGAEAVVSTASGCGAMIKEYGYLLRHDPRYAERAARVSALARDLSEVLTVDDVRALAAPRLAGTPGAVVFHPPCSLQHGLRLAGTVERLLGAAGVDLAPFADPHLCCGSAGTYSLLQPRLAEQLLERKLRAIEAAAPREIVTANIGCQLHLARRAGVPVRHWVELLEERLGPGGTSEVP